MPASFDPRSLIDPAWREHHDSIFVEGYEVALAPQLVPRKIFRFDKLVMVIKNCSLDYVQVGGVQYSFGEDRKVDAVMEHKMATTRPSMTLFTVQPHMKDRENLQDELSDISGEHVSLLISSNYRNIAFRKLFSHVADMNSSSMLVMGPLARLPFDLPPPDLSIDAMDRFRRCREMIVGLDPALKNKVWLSLHWHIKGVHGSGLDSFLSLWIAIETLAMDSANIASANDLLAGSYAISRSAASKEFGLGRIQGLRSAIVHKGLRRVISTDLTDYLECIYADILIYKLLGECSGRSRGMLASRRLDVESLTTTKM